MEAVNEDLSEILLHVARDKRPATRRRIANSIETRNFLDAGIELLNDELSSEEVSGHGEEGSHNLTLLNTLSRKRVVMSAVDMRNRSGQYDTQALQKASFEIAGHTLNATRTTW